MTGSLQERNGKFHMVFNIRDANGKRKQKWVSTSLPIKGNKRKAEQLLNQRLAEYTEETFIMEPSKQLFCDFVSDWVKQLKPNLQATTYMNYLHLLDKHVYPYFKKSKLLLMNVAPNHIQRYYAVKIEEGLNPNTVIKHHAVMRSALQFAVKTKQIKENPCDHVVKPKKKRYVAEYYTAEEIKQLLTISQGTTVEVPIFIAAYFGLTRSECLGLRWDALDFVGKVLTVRRKVVSAVVDGKLVNIDSDTLKTEARYRTLPLDDQLLEYFTEVKDRQARHKKLCGCSYGNKYQNHVCVNAMGELLNPDYVTGAFSKLLKRNGLRHIRFHDLRHSCATLLLSLGYSMKEIQEWLGHSNFQTTANIYSHVDPQSKKEMIKGLSNALKN